jgi:hypothetical protein
MAGDASAWKVFKLLTRHLDSRDDADVGRAGGQLIGAIRREGVTKIEHFAEARVGRAEKAPNQRDCVQIADGADARPGDGVLRRQLYSLAARLARAQSSASIGSCQAPGFVQRATANPARSGRKQR